MNFLISTIYLAFVRVPSERYSFWYRFGSFPSVKFKWSTSFDDVISFVVLLFALGPLQLQLQLVTKPIHCVAHSGEYKYKTRYLHRQTISISGYVSVCGCFCLRQHRLLSQQESQCHPNELKKCEPDFSTFFIRLYILVSFFPLIHVHCIVLITRT